MTAQAQAVAALVPATASSTSSRTPTEYFTGAGNAPDQPWFDEARVDALIERRMNPIMEMLVSLQATITQVAAGRAEPVAAPPPVPEQRPAQNPAEDSSDDEVEMRGQGSSTDSLPSLGSSVFGRRPSGSDDGGCRPSGSDDGGRRPSGSEVGRRRPSGSNGGDGGSLGPPPAASAVARGTRKNEPEEVRGVPGYPTVVEFGSWRRDVRYAVAAASVDPGRALAWVMKAEKWRNDVTELPVDREFETLGVKWGKALRAVVKGDKRRELQVLEERVLREKSALLDGPQVYAWINQDFARDARLARAQILQEIAACRVAAWRGALSQFMTQWDTAVERLADAGGREGDDETLYVHFRPNFMACPELAEHASKVRRSLPGSRCHTYEWLYKTAKAHLETARLERQESERMAASRPGAPQPLAPGLEQRRPPPKGAPATERQKPAPAQPAQPKADTKNLPCPRLVRGVPCNFGEEKCWYSHQAGLVSQAKAALQKPAAKKTTFAPDGGERVCRFMKQYGTCKKGDQCAFSHDVSGKRGIPYLNNSNIVELPNLLNHIEGIQESI